MNDEFIKQHVDTYKDYLIKLAAEECLELATLILRNGRFDREVRCEQFVEEIADVIVMMQFMREIYGARLVDNEIERKVQRIKDRYYND